MSPSMIMDEVEEDENYASEEDSDFAPDALPTVQGSDSEASESEDEADPGLKKNYTKPTKRKRGNEEAEDLGFENSGDEAIIGKGLKRRRKNKKGDLGDDDEGGEGGFVKTRAMKAAAEPEQTRKLVSTEGATVDVDSLWASMTSAPLKPKTIIAPIQDDSITEEAQIPSALQPVDDEPEMITIERTYNFAGKVHSETKVVSRHSAEAKLYLSSRSSNEKDKTVSIEATADDGPTVQLRRPKARRSVFEPITEATPQRTDLRFKVASYIPKVIDKAAANAKKLNTVEKSKMDWAGFVDKEGIKDDLETAAKAKGTYLDNQDFLSRAEYRREEESRQARMKGLAA